MTAYQACIGGPPDPGEDWLEVDAGSAKEAALAVADEYGPDDGTYIYIRDPVTGSVVRVFVETALQWVATVENDAHR